MGQFEKFGHYRTFACVMLVSWKNGRGKRAEPPQHRERPPGREEPGGLCVFSHHGPGSRTAGAFLLSPCPAALYQSAAGRPDPGGAQGLLCRWGGPGHTGKSHPLPRLGPFWKINLCGASEARLFSAKNPKFSGVFRYAFTKSGESIPPLGGMGRKRSGKKREIARGGG